MDIMPGFEPVVGGSNPSESTERSDVPESECVAPHSREGFETRNPRRRMSGGRGIFH